MSRSKSGELKRVKIRHAAYICFRENGYHQTSIDDICESAEISKGSFYWHYGAKLDVFIDILDVWAKEVVEELLSQFEEATRSPKRIELLSQAFEKEFHRARAIVPLWAEFSLYARHDPEIQISIAKFYRRARAAIAEILRQTAVDRLTESQIQSTSAMILGAYTGLVLQDLVDPSQSADAWAKSFMSVIGLLLRHANENDDFVRTAKKGNRLSSQIIQHFLTGATKKQVALLERLRSHILTAKPEANEKYIRGWSVVAYNFNGLVCHLKVVNNGIELAFYRGKELHDPHKITQLKGKKRRSVVFSNVNDIPQQLAGLTKNAFSFNQQK